VAVSILTDASISINGVDLSDHGSSITLNDMREKKDITAFGATSRVYAKGLGDASLSITFFQDFAAGEVHATLQPLIGSTTPVTIIAKPTSGAISATNPGWTMSGLLFDYSMLDGGVGEPSTLTVELSNASQAGIVYDIIP
jgi:hypothetical protein